MGQQYIDTIGMYGKSNNREYPSEYGANISRPATTFGDTIAAIVFNEQYGIFYYEPASEMEAIAMISKFKDKIRELEAKWVP